MGSADGRKAIFITGAASGMGLETARVFAGHGWFVGGYDVNDAGLKSLLRRNCDISWIRSLGFSRTASFFRPPYVPE